MRNEVEQELQILLKDLDSALSGTGIVVADFSDAIVFIHSGEAQEVADWLAASVLESRKKHIPLAKDLLVRTQEMARKFAPPDLTLDVISLLAL